VSERAPDVLVVGGGLIGCALAAELAGRGADVAVLDREEPGAEASGAAAGMLTPQSEAHARDALFDLGIESRAMYSAWVARLTGETGMDVGYRRCGFLHCRFAGEDAADLEWQRALGLSVVAESGEDAAALARGRLSPEVNGAFYFPDDAVVDPRLLTRAAWLAAVRRGARVRTHVAVLGFVIEKGVCRGVETSEGRVEAGAVVDAAGAWAAFGGALPVRLPIEPVRGQIVALRLPEPPFEPLVSSSDVYLVPRPDGTVLLGATVERVGFHKAVTAEAVARLIGAAVRLAPSLGDAAFATAWSGLRPATPDALPVLGASPLPGLFFAAGHHRNGILLAPVTATIVADLLTGGPPRDLSAFSVDRFAPMRRIA
jgi:glycine oxidase